MSDEASVLKIKHEEEIFWAAKWKCQQWKKNLEMHLLANLLEKLVQPTAPSKNSKSYVTNWLDWKQLTEESRNIDHLLKRKGDLVFLSSYSYKIWTKFRNVNDLKMKQIHCEITYLNFTRFFMNSKNVYKVG